MTPKLLTLKLNCLAYSLVCVSYLLAAVVCDLHYASALRNACVCLCERERKRGRVGGRGKEIGRGEREREGRERTGVDNFVGEVTYMHIVIAKSLFPVTLCDSF